MQIATLILILSLTLYQKTVADDDAKPSCDFKDKDVEFFDITLSSTLVPRNLTTYVCQTLEIPVSLDRQYHAIGFMPLIKNTKIVHHMIIFGVPDQDPKSIHYCGDADFAHRSFLVQWTRGFQGSICNHKDAGYLFGFGSVESFMLQVHWNNELGEDELNDASGFRVFYTPHLRRHDMGNVQVGQNYLEIPPSQNHYPQTGSCSSDCTSTWLQHPIYLTEVHIHMHYTGDGGSLEIVRDGSSPIMVVNDDSYDYSKPSVHTFTHPAKVEPGDEIRLTCMFNTRDGPKKRNHTLQWGEGSDGEMCYAFISYYPAVDGFDQCIQYDNHDICTRDGWPLD